MAGKAPYRGERVGGLRQRRNVRRGGRRSRATAPSRCDASEGAQQAAGIGAMVKPVADAFQTGLEGLGKGMRQAGVPYAEGMAIIGLTGAAKLLTYPLTKRQVESQMATQNLKPQVDDIKRRWENDKERANYEVAQLYQRYGVSPLDGCFPLLVTLPVTWGLYRALVNSAQQGEFQEPFFFIPSLAGPGNGDGGVQVGIGWLWPLDEQTLEPPIGWNEALPYLALPALLVLSQYATNALLPPSNASNEDDQSGASVAAKALPKILPLFLGYISLTVPAGLSLYWLANNAFTTGITYYIRYLGGANPPVKESVGKPRIKLGTAIRSGRSEPPPRPSALAQRQLPATPSIAGEEGDDVAPPSVDESRIAKRSPRTS